MQRLLSVLVGIGVVVLAVWITVKAMPVHVATTHLDAGADAAVVLDADVAAADISDAGKSLAELALGDPNFAPRGDAGAWARMEDGSPVPPLPANAPRQVHVGIILVSYAGADVGALEGPRPTRSKKDAHELAIRLAADAKTDFHGAVQRGDNGSADDMGHIPRGILEPGPEYVLFTLAPGTVSDAFETPRGFWIVKRID